MNWYLHVLKNYAVFRGRARRTEYWMYVLINMIFACVAVMLDNLLGIAIKNVGYGPIYIVYVLAIIIPSLSVGVRRLHDIGKSGSMMFLSFIPVIGAIWLWVLFMTDSKPGENEYGPNPKENQADSSKVIDLTNDSLIIFVAVWLLVSRLFWSLLHLINNQYYPAKGFIFAHNLIWAIIPVSLAFAVKNKVMKITFIILGVIYFLYDIFEAIMQFAK